jgi:hypothetical protein
MLDLVADSQLNNNKVENARAILRAIFNGFF